MGLVFESMLIAVLALMVPNIWRGISGPTVADRVIGIGLMGSKTVVALLLIGVLYGRLDLFIDCAIIYCLLNFVGVLVLSKYLIRGGLEEGR